MFKFLNALTYDGKRGTVLRLEDLGDSFRVSLLVIHPTNKITVRVPVVREAAKVEEAESALHQLSEC